MEFWSIDRLEGRFAVCEDDDGRQRKIPLEQLPPEVREGDVLCCCTDGCYTIDVEETCRRREENRRLLEHLLQP